MNNFHDDLKDTISQLTADLRSLARRVESLERTVQGSPVRDVPPVTQEPATTAAASEKQSPWSVGGVAVIMSRGAVISLVLLLALVLRTLTDGGVLNMGIGTCLLYTSPSPRDRS